MDRKSKNLWQFTALLIILAAAFAPVIPDMVDTWFRHSDDVHGVLVPLVSLYFVWLKRSEILELPKTGSLVGLTLLTFFLLFYVASYIGGIAFFCRLMLVASLIALVWACLGTEIVRALAFPLGFFS